jgi:hypothetical protein
LEIQGCFAYTLLHLHIGFLIFPKMSQYKEEEEVDEMDLSSTPPMRGCYDDLLEEYEREKYVATTCIEEARAQLGECVEYYHENVDDATHKQIQEMLMMILDARDELGLYK